MPCSSSVLLAGVLGLGPWLLSCEAAPIAAADGRASADAASFTVVADWPKLPAGTTFGRVLGVAVAPDGRVWVSHTADGEARNEAPIQSATLAVLDPDTGELLEQRGAGLFRLPHALAFDDEGLLWVTDADANRVVVLDRDGRVVRTLGVE
jgi:DNA-binding beta-propeller fold protein YncE